MSRYSKTYNRDHYRGKNMTRPINLTDVEEALRESTKRMNAALREIESNGTGLRIDPKDGYSLAPEAKEAVERLLEKHGVSGAVVKRYRDGTFSIMVKPLDHVIGLTDCRCAMCEGGRKEYRRNLGERIHEAAAEARKPIADPPYRRYPYITLKDLFKVPTGWDVFADLIMADEVDKIAPPFKGVSVSYGGKPMPGVASVNYGESPTGRTVGTFTPDQPTQAQRLKLNQHVGKPVYAVSRDTVSIGNTQGQPLPIGVVASINDDGSCMVRLNSFSNYRSQIMTFKLEAPTEPMALHEAIHRMLNNHEMPDVTGMVPSSHRVLKRLLKVLNGKNEYARSIGARKDELEKELAALRTAYQGARKEADEGKAFKIDSQKALAQRVHAAIRHGSPMPDYTGPGDSLGAVLQDIWRLVQQARAACSSPEEIERITTERLTSELRLSLDKGMHQSTDYKAWRSPWCELLNKVNNLRSDYNTAQERAINACVVDLGSVLLGRTTAADIPEKMHGGWAAKLREVFKLKGDNRDLQRKLDSKIETSTLEVLREAARIVASKTEE